MKERSAPSCREAVRVLNSAGVPEAHSTPNPWGKVAGSPPPQAKTVLCYPSQIKSLACWSKRNKNSRDRATWVQDICGPFCFLSGKRTAFNGYSIRISCMVSEAFRLPVRIAGSERKGDEISVQLIVPEEVMNELVREVYAMATKRRS